jgi:hypothetical protein
MISRIVASLVAGTLSAALSAVAQTSSESDALEQAERIESCLRDAGAFSSSALRNCASKSSCKAPAVVSRPLRLEWRDGEGHPAWSANDRARLADLGTMRLDQVMGQYSGVHRVSTSAQPIDTLTIETIFFGADSVHRELRDWVQLPRQVTITLRLQRATTNEVIGTHTIEARVPAGVQPYQRGTSSAPWLQKSLDEMQRGSTALLDVYACEPVVFMLTKTRSGQTALSLRDLQGVTAGLRVLLVPTAGRDTPEPHTIARVTAVEPGSSATLEAINGDLRSCANGDCVAVAL